MKYNSSSTPIDAISNSHDDNASFRPRVSYRKSLSSSLPLLTSAIKSLPLARISYTVLEQYVVRYIYQLGFLTSSVSIASPPFPSPEYSGSSHAN